MRARSEKDLTKGAYIANVYIYWKIALLATGRMCVVYIRLGSRQRRICSGMFDTNISLGVYIRVIFCLLFVFGLSIRKSSRRVCVASLFSTNLFFS